MKKLFCFALILCLTFAFSSIAFATDVSNKTEFLTAIADSTVETIVLTEDIELDEEVTFNINSYNRTLDTNGHIITFNQYPYLLFASDNRSFNFSDSVGSGLIIMGEHKYFRIDYDGNSFSNNTINFNGGNYWITSSTSIIIRFYGSSDEPCYNVNVLNGTFYEYNSAPFSDNFGRLYVKNMTVIGKNQNGYVGFTNQSYVTVNDVVDPDSAIFLNGVLYDCDREEYFARNIYFDDSLGNSIIIQHTFDDTMDSSISVPDIDAQVVGYSDIAKYPIQFRSTNGDRTIDGEDLTFVVEGLDKDCFQVGIDVGNMVGEGVWNTVEQFWIKPVTDLEIGQYTAILKLYWDSDGDGNCETLLGADSVGFEVVDEYVDCKYFWSTSGADYVSEVTINGTALSDSTQGDPIVLRVGDEASIVIENGEHYEAMNFVLRYNGNNTGAISLEKNAQGKMEGTFIVPCYDFIIGINSNRIDHLIILHANRGVEETVNYYSDGDEVLTIPGNIENWEYGDLHFVGWNTSSDGEGASYAVGEQLDQPDSGTHYLYLYAMWSEIVPGDLSGNGTIGIDDVRMLLAIYINCTDQSAWTPSDLALMDLNGDRRVDITDVRMLLLQYLDV